MKEGWTARSIASASIVIGLLGSACGNGGGAPSGSTEVPGSFVSWIAILAVAPDSNAFEETSREVLELAGTSIRISPATCFQGLPEEVALPGNYVLAVAAPDQEGVTAIAERTRIEPLFVGEVREICVD
jgi:hypothetical protein